jgi:hypothetical protein
LGGGGWSNQQKQKHDTTQQRASISGIPSQRQVTPVILYGF